MVRAGDREEAAAVEEESSGGLVVGSYCHDVLYRDGRIIGNGLGGAVSFVSNVLDAISISSSFHHHIVSKVGSDFGYSSSLPHHHPSPLFLIAPSSPTTLFHAHFSSSSSTKLSTGNGDRVLSRVRACDPIFPSDLPSPGSPRFGFGLAVGVAGEISPETLAWMLDLCRTVFVDAQALIRTFDPADGTVGLIPLRDTPFFRLLPRIGVLKASAVEAPFVDVEQARRWCCVVVTDGEHGCRVYWKDGEMQVPALPADEVDPTGAGDSFLGGFTAGLLWGLRVPEAALLGNFFGSLTVGQIGIPKFDQKMIQPFIFSFITNYPGYSYTLGNYPSYLELVRAKTVFLYHGLIVRQELERLTIPCGGLRGRSIGMDFRRSDKHEEFHVCLTEAAKLVCTCESGELDDD